LCTPGNYIYNSLCTPRARITIIRVKVVVLYATFNNISVILWLSVLLVEETTDLP
jgi:hypothetical protein